MEAEKFLRKVARINGKDFDVVCQEKLQRLTDGYAKVARNRGYAKKASSWLDLLKTPNLRRRMLFLMYLSCNVNVVYSGLNYFAPGTVPVRYPRSNQQKRPED